jgi:nucleotide-binding universal stress UspA family protein
MDECKHVLVGLDISTTDISTIRYAGLISHLTPAERVTFLHVSRELDVAESREIRYPQLPEPLSVFVKARLQDTVTKYFHGHPDTEVTWEVEEGTPLTACLHWAHHHDVDLILVGKTPHSVLPGQLARRAPCPVLAVPASAPPRITRLLVPVDFSEHAAAALDLALVVARTYGVTSIVCQHVYDVPHAYHVAGLVDDALSALPRQHAQKEYDAFMTRFDLSGITVKPLLTQHARIATGIQESAVAEGVDLIIMGARGRTVAAAMFLGSVTEKLLQVTSVPLWVVLKKGERLGLLDALLHHA